MSYPFTKAPNSTEFATVACRDFDCEILRTGVIRGPRREEVMWCLTRRVDGRVLISEVFPTDEKEPLLPSTIQRICRQLQIPCSKFGLDLN